MGYWFGKKCYLDILDFQEKKFFFSENFHFSVTWFELLAETYLLNMFNLRYINDNQSNRSEGDFDFDRISDQSKEESNCKHIQSSED